MSNKPLWFTGLAVVIVGVIWWGLVYQQDARARKMLDDERVMLEAKSGTYRGFIVEQEQQLKAMKEKLQKMDEEILLKQYGRLQKELKDLPVNDPAYKRDKERLMIEMSLFQQKIAAGREEREKLESRIGSFEESVTNSRNVLAESEKRLKELRAKKG